MPPNPAPRITIRGFMAVGYCHRVAVGRNAPRATYVADPTTRAYRHATPGERGERAGLKFTSLAADALEQLTAAAIGYARRVEEALRPTLTGLDLPLILAASEPLDS